MNLDATWSKVQQGDLSSFENLYGEFYPGLCQYAFQLLNDRFLAEETVQDIFLKLWETRHNISSQGYSLKKYLYRITHNQCIDALKRNNTKKAKTIRFLSFDTWATISEKYGFDEYLVEKIETEETSVLVDKVVEGLPAQCREIFRLSRNEEKTNEEIAGQMGLSESTIRVQLYRATQKIRKELFFLLWLLLFQILMYISK
jgi:RNA polymerase sigma-70 factor (ECF subfamily)